MRGGQRTFDEVANRYARIRINRYGHGGISYSRGSKMRVLNVRQCVGGLLAQYLVTSVPAAVAAAPPNLSVDIVAPDRIIRLMLGGTLTACRRARRRGRAPLE